MKNASPLAKAFRANAQIYTLILALAVLWAVFAAATGGAYLSAQNISNLFRQMTIIGFMACGMVLVIVTGGIDLSVGKLAGLVSVLVAVLQSSFNPWLITSLVPGADPLTINAASALISLVVGILAGALIGAIQGGIIAYLAVPAFIVTLGGLFIFRGAILAVTQGKTIPANQPVFTEIGQGYLPGPLGLVLAVLAVVAVVWFAINTRRKRAEYKLETVSLAADVAKMVLAGILIVGYVLLMNLYQGVQIPVLLLALVAVTLIYLSNNTRFGRYAYAIGGNREATRLSGIDIKKNIFKIFVLMGTLCGVAGVSLASYVGYGTIAAGEGYELDVIAACILGGTSTLGGEGTVIGALIGAMVMASLSTGMTMLNSPPALVYMVKGMVFILAVLVDVTIRKSASKA